MSMTREELAKAFTIAHWITWAVGSFALVAFGLPILTAFLVGGLLALPFGIAEIVLRWKGRRVPVMAMLMTLAVIMIGALFVQFSQLVNLAIR